MQPYPQSAPLSATLALACTALVLAVSLADYGQPVHAHARATTPNCDSADVLTGLLTQ